MRAHERALAPFRRAGGGVVYASAKPISSTGLYFALRASSTRFMPTAPVTKSVKMTPKAKKIQRAVDFSSVSRAALRRRVYVPRSAA